MVEPRHFQSFDAAAQSNNGYRPKISVHQKQNSSQKSSHFSTLNTTREKQNIVNSPLANKYSSYVPNFSEEEGVKTIKVENGYHNQPKKSQNRYERPSSARPLVARDGPAGEKHGRNFSYTRTQTQGETPARETQTLNGSFCSDRGDNFVNSNYIDHIDLRYHSKANWHRDKPLSHSILIAEDPRKIEGGSK